MTAGNAIRPQHGPNVAVFSASLVVFLVFGWILAFYAHSMVAATKDFGSFYESARRILDGRDMYELVTTVNLNPPHFQLLILPIGWLPIATAWAVWLGASIVALFFSLRIISRELQPALTPWRTWILIVAIVASAPTLAEVITGQLAWLLMWPMTIAWRAARRGRWLQAGAIWGALISVKPFLALFALYLIVHRRWRAAAAAAGVATACTGIGMIVFGVQLYWQWLRLLRAISWPFLPLNASVMGFLSRTISGFQPETPEHVRFQPLVDAQRLVFPMWAAAVAAIAIVTFVAVRRESSRDDIDRNLTLLLLAAVFISPLGWIYYLFLGLGPALAWGLTVWREQTWPRWLLAAGIAGLFWPPPAATLFQPSAGATLAVASVYFWSTLCIWTGLVVSSNHRKLGTP